MSKSGSRTQEIVTGTALGAVALVAGLAVAQSHMAGAHIGHPPPPEGVELKETPVIVPMESFGGRPVVSLLLDGKGPFQFVLDTGAGGCVVSRALTDSLGLEASGDVRVGSPGGATNPGAFVKIGKVEMGGATLRGVTMIATDLSRVFHLPGAPVGVLSALVFAGNLVTFDYPKQQILIRPGELPAANGGDVFEYQAAQYIPTMTIDVAGTKVQAHVDSGSGRGVMLPGALAKTVPLGGALEEQAKVKTVDGEWPIHRAPLKGTVSIGRFKLTDPAVDFMEGAPVGNIGYEFLKDYRLTLDRKNLRFRLEPGAAEAPARPAA
jgi:aspartyl protease